MGSILSLAALVAMLVTNTQSLRPITYPDNTAAQLAADAESAIANLSQALRFKTIAQVIPGSQNQLPKTLVDNDVFTGFRDFLQQTYPTIHTRLPLRIIAEHSLLFHWPGTDSKLEPIVLLAHQDVVPYSLQNRHLWHYPPFSGEVAEGYVWGRGTLDDKGSLIAIMEAVENLVASGWQPARSVYLAFGHDEEVGGTGAAAIADYFRQAGITPALLLDEGGFVMQDIIPGIQHPIGLIGIAEKGYLSVELSATGEVGHSSRPPRQTAAAIIASAVAKLDTAPPEARLDGATVQLFEVLAPHMGFAQRLAFANQWLTEPLLLNQLTKKPATNATVRTTQAITMLNAGHKDNALPASASAVINYRLLPNDSVDELLTHITSTIDDDRVTVNAYPFASEATKVSATDTLLFRKLAGTAQTLFQNQQAIIAPYLTIGATDARHFTKVARNTYRFLPILLHGDDLARLHGPNERIKIDDFLRMIQFYGRLIQELGGLGNAG